MTKFVDAALSTVACTSSHQLDGSGCVNTGVAAIRREGLRAATIRPSPASALAADKEPPRNLTALLDLILPVEASGVGISGVRIRSGTGISLWARAPSSCRVSSLNSRATLRRRGPR